MSVSVGLSKYRSYWLSKGYLKGGPREVQEDINRLIYGSVVGYQGAGQGCFKECVKGCIQDNAHWGVTGDIQVGV